MKKSFFLLAVVLTTAMLQAAPKKLLVVTTTTGFRHSSIPTAEKILAQLAQESGEFTVDFVEQPPGPHAANGFFPKLKTTRRHDEKKRIQRRGSAVQRGTEVRAEKIVAEKPEKLRRRDFCQHDWRPAAAGHAGISRLDQGGPRVHRHPRRQRHLSRPSGIHCDAGRRICASRSAGERGMPESRIRKIRPRPISAKRGPSSRRKFTSSKITTRRKFTTCSSSTNIPKPASPAISRLLVQKLRQRPGVLHLARPSRGHLGRRPHPQGPQK